MPFCQNMLLIA